MTMNDHFASKSVSGPQLMGWHLRLSDKTIRKFAELPVPTYCQRQKFGTGNIVSGSIRFMQVYAGVRCHRWRGGVKWEWGRWKRWFSLHSFTVFRTFYIHGHTTAFRWYNCQWPWAYFKVIGLFHIKFPIKRCVIRQTLLQSANRRSYTSFQLVLLLMTLKYI